MHLNECAWNFILRYVWKHTSSTVYKMYVNFLEFVFETLNHTHHNISFPFLYPRQCILNSWLCPPKQSRCVNVQSSGCATCSQPMLPSPPTSVARQRSRAVYDPCCPHWRIVVLALAGSLFLLSDRCVCDGAAAARFVPALPGDLHKAKPNLWRNRQCLRVVFCFFNVSVRFTWFARFLVPLIFFMWCALLFLSDLLTCRLWITSSLLDI